MEPDKEDTPEPAKDDFELEFVKRIRSTLEKKWNQADFSTDKLASELGMSRSSFYLKCKAITNVPPAEAIKNYRLGKAKELLASGSSVSEVAVLVGYSETSPFSRAFKKRFKCTPAEVQKRS
ncbi:AraC family transcriptional regulator [Puniceicoccaceae bacterium K14]|nr:AraC family transcriptional regulator [Puniceicoccaceae bacterium K14]